MAHSLAVRGWSVTVLDQAPGVGAGASGLPAGLAAPHVSPDDNVLSRITGSPSVYEGKVLVPISSIEDPMTHVGSHACCSSRGGVVALDAATGKIQSAPGGDDDDAIIEDVPSDGDDAALRAHLLEKEQQQWKAEQERWYGE